jgi:hypothetical protein
MKEKNLQFVLDWMAIQELVAEYGQAVDAAVDSGEWSRWAQVFTPQVTADYTRFLGGEPLHVTREQLADIARTALAPFSRLQHSTANSVRIDFTSDTQARVVAYAEANHYFSLGGAQQEWVIVARYTHEVEKGAEGWRIRRVSLDPVHYRGNPLGLELIRGKRLS